MKKWNSRLLVVALLGANLLAFQNCTKGFGIADNVGTGIDFGLGDFHIAGLTVSHSADSSISANVFGSPLTISTSSRTAGAINSLTWQGKEFIDAADHGRELQSAAFFSMTDCLNPTEAGSANDNRGNTSSSVLLGENAENNVLQTTVQMAYWSQCTQPVLSNDRLSKQVTIGTRGLENVIEYLVSFQTAEDHDYATFEAVTAYMPAEFSQLRSFNPVTGALKTLTAQGEQNVPVVLSTADNAYAMGVYSPELPQVDYSQYGYGVFSYDLGNAPGDKGVKWNAVFRTNAIKAGTYSFRMFVIVGSLTQVESSMVALNQQFHPTANPPTVNVTTTSASGSHNVIGYVDGLTADGSAIQGWACATGMNDSIGVHLYAGGAAGAGTFVTAAVANQGSEPAVAARCENSASANRFLIPLSDDLKRRFAGQTLYVHGISPVGGSNDVIERSGVYTMPAALSVISDLQWSYAGPIAGRVCTQIIEPSDSHTWSDNYLCGTRDWGLRWSFAGPIDGMVCTQIIEPSDADTWQDNYLCAPQDHGFQWSFMGPIAGKNCVQIIEPADPDAWQDNYLCGP